MNVYRLSSVGLPGAASPAQLIQANLDFVRLSRAGRPAEIVRQVNNDGRLKFGGLRFKTYYGLAGKNVLLSSEIFPGGRPGLAIWELNEEQDPVSLVKTYLWDQGRLAEPISSETISKDGPGGWADKFPPDWPRVGPLKEHEAMLRIISACRWGEREVFGRRLGRPDSVFFPVAGLRKGLFCSGNKYFYHRKVVADRPEDYEIEIRQTDFPDGRGVVSWLVDRQTHERFFPLMKIKLFDIKSGRFLPWDQIKKEPYLFAGDELIPDSPNPRLRKLVWLAAKGPISEDGVKIEGSELALVELPGDYGKKVVYSLIDHSQKIATRTQKGGPRSKRLTGLKLQGISRPVRVMLEILTPELAAALTQGGRSDWLEDYRALVVWRLDELGRRRYPWALKAVAREGRLIDGGAGPVWETERTLGLPKALPLKQVPRMKSLIFRLAQTGKDLENKLAPPQPAVLRYGCQVRHLALYDLGGRTVNIETGQSGREFFLVYVKLEKDQGGLAVFLGRDIDQAGFQGAWQLTRGGTFLETPVQIAEADDYDIFALIFARDLAAAGQDRGRKPPTPAAEPGPAKTNKDLFLAARLGRRLAEISARLGEKPDGCSIRLALAGLLKTIKNWKPAGEPSAALTDLAYIIDKISWHLQYPTNKGGETLKDWLENSRLVAGYRRDDANIDRFVKAVLKGQENGR